VSSATAVLVSRAVAEQLTSASQAGHLGPFSFQANHSLILPRNANEDFSSLVVNVRAIGDVQAFASRVARQHDYTIEVCIRKAVDDDDSLLADNLLLLCEKIADYWQKDDTDTHQTRTLTGRDEKLVSPVGWAVGEDDLQKHQVVKGVITLTFRGWR
jgi:hypothetical protein